MIEIRCVENKITRVMIEKVGSSASTTAGYDDELDDQVEASI